jgi:hypothetical protein
VRILYCPQYNLDKTIEYSFSGEAVTATIDGVTDTIDFSDMPEGSMDNSVSSMPAGAQWVPPVETTLPINPIIGAERADGVLYVTLLRFIDNEATDDDKFPGWQEV